MKRITFILLSFCMALTISAQTDIKPTPEDGTEAVNATIAGTFAQGTTWQTLFTVNFVQNTSSGVTIRLSSPENATFTWTPSKTLPGGSWGLQDGQGKLVSFMPSLTGGVTFNVKASTGEMASFTFVVQ